MSKRYCHDGRDRPGSIWWYLAIALLFFEIVPAQALSPGDILVIDFDAGRNFRGVLFRLDPVSGVRTRVSNFNNLAQGPLGVFPFGVAIEATGAILVIDQSAGRQGRGALFRVDPVSGVRSLVSEFGDRAQGPLGVEPSSVALEATGDILVTDEDAGRAGRGFLFRVDPVSGVRTRVSNFGNPAQGSRGMDPAGVAIEATGDILVTDDDAGRAGRGVLFRVDPVSGVRTRLSTFGNPAQGSLLGSSPFGVAIEVAGTALVIDRNHGRNFRGSLFRVDPVSGVRTRLSDFNDRAQGPRGVDPVGVAIEATGAILVIDRGAGRQGRGVLFRVDPVSGVRTRVSNFGNPVQGPRGREPSGVAVVPFPETAQGTAP